MSPSTHLLDIPDRKKTLGENHINLPLLRPIGLPPMKIHFSTSPTFQPPIQPWFASWPSARGCSSRRIAAPGAGAVLVRPPMDEGPQ